MRRNNNHEHHIIDKSGSIILSSLSKIHIEYYRCCNSTSEIIKKCQFDGLRKRHGKISTDKITVYIISSRSPLLNNQKLMKVYLNVYAAIIETTLNESKSFIEGFNQRTRRILHNLRSLNAHNIQEIEALVPQKSLSDNLFDQVDTIKNAFDEYSDDFASGVLRTMKNNLAMKVEFNVFDKMFELSPELRIESYRIDRVLLNVLQTFFQDFTDLRCSVMIEQTEKDLKLDYESFQVCLYLLFENAVKYILPQKDLRIKFSESKGDFVIELDMISLKIHDDEVEAIFEEGISGREARRINRQGQGIGMYRLNRLIKMNNASIELIRCAEKYSCRYGNTTYENNKIQIKFMGQGSYL